MIRVWRYPVLAILLLLSSQSYGAALSSSDAAFREGWSHLIEEDYARARAAFERISSDSYDLGDYVLYFTGLSLAREGNRGEAAALHETLQKVFPQSPLVPHLSHALAYAAAVDNDLPAARAYYESSRGRVNGNGSERKAEQGYVAARLLEEGGPSAAAAEAHLDNFASHTAQEAAFLSMERLGQWRRDGKWEEWGLPVAFYGKFAKALSRAAENETARAVYAEAIRKFPPSDDYYTVLLDYAELLRKLGDTAGSRALLDRASLEAPPAFRNEVAFLRARVDWKAGRLKDARATFLAIAEEQGVRPGTADRARYLAAWIAEEEGDIAAATEAFGKLRGAQDETIRQEAAFRNAFGHYRLKKYPEAAALFEGGKKSGFSSVERARHMYWMARAHFESGRKEEGDRILSALATDPGGGPYALFAAKLSGGDPYAMLNARSSGETASCGKEKEQLWQAVRNAGWGKEDAEKIRRAERLIGLGVAEYAVLEASRIDPGAIRKALGLADGGTPGLVRYLAGDLRGAIRATSNVHNDPAKVELIDRIQFPLAPDYVGDCERKRSGVDPLLLHSIIRQESQFQQNALSPSGAVGLMQLLPRTAAEVARKEKMRRPRRRDLLRPQVNVALGAAYLSRLVRGYGGDYLRAVAAYNAGESSVARWWGDAKGDPALFLEKMTYRETRFYLRRVFFNVLQYYRIYRPKMFSRYFPTAPKGSPQEPGVSSPQPSGATGGAPPEPAKPPAAGQSGG
ncbi:MAG: transglycosylase SLT domain-containing protein [Deltaproteobacteria bacterium]|nr:transglycosylase SLT domain-containing protein [Deltaproteobacteria bacterium]